MAKWLTKSNYKNYLIHPAFLWLAKHAPDKLPPFGEQAQAIVDQGNEVDAIAQQLYSGGVKITDDLFAGIDETAVLMRTSGTAQVIFQPSVLTKRNLYARADIIERGEDKTDWDLTEVKSGVGVKPDHIADLAFQKVCFEEAGHKIGRIFVTHINRFYVRKGELDPQKLLLTVEVTDKVEKLMAKTKRNIEAALKIMEQKECPDDHPMHASNYYAWRDIYRNLHPEISENSIYNLTRLNVGQIKELAKLGVESIEDIPATVTLKPQQVAQIVALKAGKPTVRTMKIMKELGKLKFPLYFFDYETVFPAIPRIEGTRPYQQVPFQYSLHILHEDGRMEHREFLYRGQGNPMPELLEALAGDYGEGTWISWNKQFEMGVNRALIRLYPEHGPLLRDINKRMYDLMDVFAKGHYADGRFFGSASIKKVLPVLVPELKYSELEIGDGGTASNRWLRAWKGEGTESEREELFKHLLVYCGQDTLAMVKIYEFLTGIADSLPKQMQMI